MKSKMMEVKILTKEMSSSVLLGTLQYLHKSVLRHDTSWHFFWEDFYTVIRCRRVTLFFLKRKLDRLGITYQDIKPWVDENLTVERFKDTFIQVFHSHSELIVHTEREAFELIQPIERAVHSLLLNHYPLFFTKVRNNAACNTRPLYFEPFLLNLLLKDRLEYIKYYYSFYNNR